MRETEEGKERQTERNREGKERQSERNRGGKGETD